MPTEIHDDGVYVTLDTPNATSFRVDVLVARMLVSNEDGYDRVKHIDGDQQNNYYGNLLWVRSLFEQRKVKCVNSGEVFDNPSIAADTTGLTRKTVIALLDGKMPSARGVVLCDLLECDIPEQWKFTHGLDAYPSKGYHLIHMNTGRIYPSIVEASRSTGVTIYRLRMLLSGEIFEHKFNRFSYLFMDRLTDQFINQNFE